MRCTKSSFSNSGVFQLNLSFCIFTYQTTIPIYLNDHIRAVDDFIQLVPDSLAHASTKNVFSLCVLKGRNIHLFQGEIL